MRSDTSEEGVKASQLARQIMRGGIRARHPEYSSDQVEEALARLLWGDELYRAAKPGLPLLTYIDACVAELCLVEAWQNFESGRS